MKKFGKYIYTSIILIAILGIFSLNADRSAFNNESVEVSLLPEPAGNPETPALQNPPENNKQDSTENKYPVRKTFPEEYKDVTQQYPIDLQTPQNLQTDFEYDPATNTYLFRSKIGNSEVTTPLSLTPEQYLEYSMQKSMDSYYRKKNQDEFLVNTGEKEAFSLFDMSLDIGPADKIFGPGGVKLQAQGNALVKMAINQTENKNPTMTQNQRKRTSFDFDQQIQANVNASVGDRVNFGLNYNTETTFDFDTKKIKLAYEGKEDEIIKTLEAGNVSMSTSNSLIRGGAALFGIKTDLQFGKLRVGAIFSQQESQSQKISPKNGILTTPFEIKADAYDENKHFFLSYYFRDNYENSLKYMPQINSAISIDKIEVWITNTRANFDEPRNLVAFSDLGEHDHISNKAFVQPTGTNDKPSNDANNLYNKINTSYTGARDISTVTQTLSPTLEAGRDYEKIENARKLTPNEYTVNKKLGYISLKGITLQPDQCIAVAFNYITADGSKQVGEFSWDDTDNPSQTLYVKLIKGTNQSPAAPYWDLMMKNIYSLNTYSLQQDKFRLNIMYQNDSTGTYLNYISEGKIGNPKPQLLLRVMNLDRLDSKLNPHADGFFDFMEGYTVLAQEGKIIFPVVEPFGEHLREAIGVDSIAKKYVFQELYDSTLTVARQIAEKNKFILQGEYKGSSSSSGGFGGSGGGASSENCYPLNGYNVVPGSVRVMANGVLLKENTDYRVDYISGEVCITNETYKNVTPEITSENQSNYGMQRKTLMGADVQYQFSPDFTIGGTIMNLKEMPLLMKVNMGEEAVNNTLFGFNANYKTQSQWLTNLFDKLPFVELSAPSTIAFSGEYAQLIPGHYKSEYGGDYSYIDDFERTKVSLDLRYPYNWMLASTPESESGSPGVSNNIDDNKKRALLAWYSIDRLFTRSKSSLIPSHLKNDKIQLSDPYVREYQETELFPNKVTSVGESASLPILNVAFYPTERGPYNLDADNINPANGRLSQPETRWGGMMRKIESSYTDFEANNIEYIEFWLLDPFINESSTPPDQRGGNLYFNIGEISEDILKDGKKFFENGLPVNGDTTAVQRTVWGKVPTRQSLTYAFDNSSTSSRSLQDVGLNGLSTEEELKFNTYADYLNKLRTKLPQNVIDQMENDQFSPFNDPSGDNYHYYRGSDYDAQEKSILERYKRYNGTEGNSRASEDSGESYDTSAKSTPDVEDINQDNTLNENEKFFEYKIELKPSELEVGKNFIVDKKEVSIKVETESGLVDKTVNWYQYKIPVKSGTKVGGITDLKTIRFMRMLLDNFKDSVILRFATLELVKGDWRPYAQDLSNPNLPPKDIGSLSVSAVNLEENSNKKPVNYVLPPGVNRIYQPGQNQIYLENEQALALQINNLSAGDARAVYKSSGLDTRQYRRLQMFVHAEEPIDDTHDLKDDEVSIFLRLGSDYKNNYYEYEIPLKLTPEGAYNDNSASSVWPSENMFDFEFKVLTDLKLERNKEKRRANSTVTYSNVYSKPDPNKPGNKISIIGNPTLSEIKVIMIGVRNNSRNTKSIEVWTNELRLTEFNEDGGWAGNANLNIGISDLATVNVQGKMETAGFGGLDQGIMERNIDDIYEYNIATSIDVGKLLPKQAKVSLPMYYSYSEQVVSPKYDPLNEDILLKESLDAVESITEKDSIKNYAQEVMTNKNITFSNVKVDIKSKNPMPYDPANFTFGYSLTETNKQDANTEYERNKRTSASMGYDYSPVVKPFAPFKNIESKSGALKFAKEFSLNYLPNALSFGSELTRDYYEFQLRDLNSLGTGNPNLIDPAFREDFYWYRDANLQWNLTPNLTFSLTTGTQARIEGAHVLVNKKINPDEYQIWKDSVLQSIADMGTPIAYKQSFTASYSIPFKYIPILNWMSGNLTYTSMYNWDKGAMLDPSISNDIEIGNDIKNERTMGLSGLNVSFTNLYNKSAFLRETNQKFNMKKPSPPRQTQTKKSTTNNNTPGKEGEERKSQKDLKKEEEEKKKKAEEEKKKKRYEAQIKLNTDSATIVKHQLDNKRMRVTARGADGKLYEIKYKAIDNNSIRITNKDTASLKLVINQLPKLEETTWYKVAQVATRGLMMVRTATLSYTLTDGMMLPYFRPNVGDFFGQGSTSYGYAPGVDFAFGFAGKNYVDKALDRDWLIKNENNIEAAIFNKTENFNLKAVLEPFTGMRIDLDATWMNTKTERDYFMFTDRRIENGGTFTMSTIAIGSSFEKGDATNSYTSKSFDKFLSNRQIIANRLGQDYQSKGVQYPSGGTFDPSKSSFSKNSMDVLVPSFLAAYTGKDPNNVSLSLVPSLWSMLPNWSAQYEGFMQLDIINEHFKSFTFSHKYNCKYVVGGYNSYTDWLESDVEGYGFIKKTDGSYTPSSGYNIPSVSIIETFNPLIGLNAQFRNNMTMKLELKNSRNLQLNAAAYQIIEATSDDYVIGVGYKLTEFNKVLKTKGTDNFSNDLSIAADLTFKRMQSLIRKIQEEFTQATSGEAQTTIKVSAKYNLSRYLTLEAFYDKQISQPLVSVNSYPFSKASFGVSLNISLTR